MSPFARPASAVQVSPAGGQDPRWRRDGKEIFFLSLDGKLMAAAVGGTTAEPVVGTATPLFPLSRGSIRWSYDVSADGQRILAITRRGDGDSVPLTFLVGWPGLLR